MTKRQFLLGIFCLIAVLGFLGVWGVYKIQSQSIAAQTAVETAKIDLEIVKTKESEATTRSKERWDWVDRLPGLKK